MRAGQALIVVLLVVGVALTVGLAVVSRGVTEVGTSTVQDESSRALSAAEAGIEQSLGGIIPGSGGGSVGSSGDGFTVQRVAIGGTSSYVLAEKLAGGETATLLLNSSFNAVGNSLTVCWGESGPNQAIQIMAYYINTVGDTVLNTRAYDSDGARVASNGFALANQVGAACPQHIPDFQNKTSLSSSDLVPSGGGNTPLYLRVRMLYNGSSPQPVAFVAGGSWSFPGQGEEITAVGQAGGATQKVTVLRGVPDWIPIWDDAVFSGTDLRQ